MTTVGFAGLGNMGGPMARNLAAAGHRVRVYDLVPELMGAVEGGEPQDSAAAAARGVDVFVSMLPAGRHVAGLYLGDGPGGGVLEHLPPDTLVIDCSTIDPATAQRVRPRLRKGAWTCWMRRFPGVRRGPRAVR